VTPAAIARLSPASQRYLAVALLALAVVVVLVILLGPVVYLHRRYNAAIEDLSDRLTRYERVAAQAPELRQALEVVKNKDGRRFYLKNTAPNLANAELADLVRTAIENNGGRITTSQNPGSRDEGNFRQITVNVQFFASTPALAKILYALDQQVPYLTVDNMSVRPLNAFRGFKPAPGQEPENNVQLDVSALAYPEPTRPAAPSK
jgi:hypothetical protein